MACVEPVLAVCGPPDAGRAALLEGVARELGRRGLRVVVAGQGRAAAGHEREALVGRLLDEHDLVLVDGRPQTPLPEVWLAAGGEGSPSGVEGVLATLAGGDGQAARLLSFLDRWLPAVWAARPRLGGVLVGGESRRMGRPKPAVRYRGGTLAEVVVGALEPLVERVLLLGDGHCPPPLAGLERLPDAPDASGPMAGILAALRWAPRATWVIAACDLPLLTPAAVAWLLEQRAPGRWAVLPSLDGERLEPLLAVYEPQARVLLERLARKGLGAPRLITADGPVHCPAPPPELRRAWTNVNTPEQLTALEEGRGDGTSEA